MANDLKPMLSKVLSSGGEKKFFFAYGVGKRKDKKADGELAVSGKKPKKADVEEALDACKEFMEGVCWVGKGEKDGDTIYFQCKGKKLSQMVVTKMALSAKALTSKQYDFQVPSPEEEARADKLADGESEETETEAEDGSTAGAGLAAEWKSKLAEWTPAIKAAGKGPNAVEVAKLLAQATNLAKPDGDFAQAIARLAECHQLATAETPPGKDGASAEVPAALHKQLLLALCRRGAAASDSVDKQIAACAVALRKKDDEDLSEIADMGLNALTGNFKVRLMALLLEAASAKGNALRQVAAKGQPVAQGFLARASIRTNASPPATTTPSA